MIWVSIPSTFDKIKLSPLKYCTFRPVSHTVGLHVAIDSLWPNCTIPSPENTAFAGYVPTSDVALEVRLVLFVYSIQSYFCYLHLTIF